MSHREAAAAVKSFIKQYRHLAEYAEALESVANLEDEQAAAKASTAAAKAESEKAAKALKDMQAKLKAVAEKHEDAAKMSAALANETIVRAKTEATLIVAKANAQAGDIVSKAEAKGAAARVALDQEVKNLQARLQGLNDEITVALNAKQSLENELNTLNGKIDGAKAKIAALLKE